MPRSMRYSPTQDQAALSAKFDLERVPHLTIYECGTPRE